VTPPLSVRAALAGRRLLVTGATGFLGKVWLAHLLAELPELGPVAVLVRPGRAGARARLEELLATSPAFWPLHEHHGADLGRALAGRLEPLAGDVATPDLGLDAATLARLAGHVDLVVHLAGITDLEPTLEDALATNVDGARHALDVARRVGARLLHVSTAYVAGARRGLVEERVPPGSPGDPAFDAARELTDLRRLVRRAREEAREQAVERDLIDRARTALARQGLEGQDAEPELEAAVARERAAWIAARTDGEARARAARWGWANVYTMSKALAEAALVAEAGTVPLSIARPSIVESARTFPFPGWKEGLETSGPLTWALTRGPLRALPARPGLILDIAPVDLVARGLTLLAAAHLEAGASDGERSLRSGDRPPAVAHLGTSTTNPLTITRTVELTALAYRHMEGRDRGPLDARALLTPDAAATGDLAYRTTSVPLLRRLAGAARAAADLAAGALEALPEPARALLPRALGDDPAAKARGWSRQADRAQKKLGELDETVARFRPFVLEFDVTFEAAALEGLAARLVAAEQAAFGWEPRSIDWRAYWLDVHLPGLRRWVWPLLEHQRLEKLPRRPISLAAPSLAEPRPLA